MAPRTVSAILLLAPLAAPAQAADSQAVLQHSLLEIYGVLKYCLLALSLVSLIAIAAHGYSGRFSWAWLTSLGLSAALLLLAPHIIEAATGARPTVLPEANARLSWQSAANEAALPDIDGNPPPDNPAAPGDRASEPGANAYRAQRLAAITAHCYAVHPGHFGNREQCMNRDWQHDHESGYLHDDGFWSPLCHLLDFVCTPPARIPFRYVPPA